MARRSIGIALALALVIPALLAPRRAQADGASETVHDATAAQEHYSAGRESYRAGSYAKALDYFERSLALAPSPNTRLYLARTLRELGRSSEAADQYRATIREAEARGGKYVATRDAADMELRELKVPADRSDPVAKTVATAPAERSHEDPAAFAVTVPSAPPTPGGPTTLTWVSGGVAVAGTVSFAVLYALAGDRYGYLEDNCTRVRDAACDAARSTGKSEELVAYVSLGIAAAAAAVAVVSLVLRPSSSSAAARGIGPWPLTF